MTELVAQGTTTSGTFAARVTLTTPSLTGTYKVMWSCVLSGSTTAVDPEARLQNTTDVATVGVAQRFDNVTATEKVVACGWADIVFAGAAKTFELQWRRAAGSNPATANIEDARICIFRVS